MGGHGSRGGNRESGAERGRGEGAIRVVRVELHFVLRRLMVAGTGSSAGGDLTQHSGGQR